MIHWALTGNSVGHHAAHLSLTRLKASLHQDDWWFRGAPTRDAPPADGEVSILPAGGSLMLEITCNIAYSTIGGQPDNNVACPGNNGSYHSGDPNGPVDYSLLAGCALAIADVTDIADVTVDNLAVFSVQKECVWQRDTTFDIPAAMPPCTGDYCICAWLWEPQNGTGNYYQTPFRCDVTGSPVDATPISMPLVDPTFCPNGGCTTGAKRPIYYYNDDYSNVNWQGNYLRPAYLADWSWTDGAQNDIFMTKAQASAYAANHTSSSTSGSNSTVAAPTTSYSFANDLALKAVATASSYASGQPPSDANDGYLGGYVNVNGKDGGNDTAEWSSNGEGVGAWLLLTWSAPVTMSSVVVYDRPNLNDHCTGFTLTFADGSVQTFGSMNNDGTATPVTLAATISSKTLKWTCTGVSAYTTNIGLSEIQVYAPTGSSSSSAAVAASASASSFRSTVALSSSAKPVAASSSIKSTVSSSVAVTSIASSSSAKASSSAVKASSSSASQSAPVKPSSSIVLQASSSSKIASSSAPVVASSSSPVSKISSVAPTASKVSSSAGTSSTPSPVVGAAALPSSSSSLKVSSSSKAASSSSTKASSSSSIPAPVVKAAQTSSAGPSTVTPTPTSTPTPTATSTASSLASVFTLGGTVFCVQPTPSASACVGAKCPARVITATVCSATSTASTRKRNNGPGSVSRLISEAKREEISARVKADRRAFLLAKNVAR
ncbi:hypothetical protein P7C70_g1779, partial [Phenoliferia sp. Uapishka_3]